ncbi:MAG: fibronectin type III domain-containing protein [Gordonia sp. (in: high G+C Gram-positive bacteria)]
MTRKASRSQVGGIAAVAILLAVLLAFGLHVFSPGRSLPDVPTGLQVSVTSGVVQIHWNSVDGADEYRLVRDGSAVVYQGSESLAQDPLVPAGRHSYQLRAISGGRQSQPSQPTSVTIDSAWGAYATYASQFPDLFPITPDGTGWQGSNCLWMIRPDRSELGSGERGSGRSVFSARIACSSNQGPSVQVAWFVSPEASDSYFGEVSTQDGAQAVSWRYGSGYTIEKDGEIYLRLDSRKDVFFGISKSGATKDQLISIANSLPVDH